MPHPTLWLRSLGVVGVLFILSDCASSPEPQLAVCDGQHRRPANPYGSVLPTTPGPDATKNADAPPTPSTTVAQPTSAPATPPRPRASLDPRSFDPCGAAA